MFKQRRTARRITLPRSTGAVSRRSVLAGGAATLAQLGSTVIAPQAIAEVKPAGKMVLAWHTNIAARWLDPQQHDGTASPDNFLMALHDGLIKNFRDEHYDHPALAERYEFAEDAKSATFWLRPGIKFHDGTPITPADVKWSYEHYHGAWGEVLRKRDRRRRDRGRPHRPVPFQGAVPRLPDPVGNRQRMRCRLGGASEILRTGRAGRVPAKADWCRSLQAGLAAARA